METYFNIRYEFNTDAVHHAIGVAVSENRPGYICVADANVLTMAHKDKTYRQTLAESLFAICDSSWVPLFLRRIYGIERTHYCGAQIFKDVVSSCRYRMAFLGGQSEALKDLKTAIAEWNPGVTDMPFVELPFLPVENFDYPAIAAHLNAAGVDIIWVGLGAPKQERFVQRLLPHLNRGVMIGVGAVFNFYSGHVRRAPTWMRKLHLEFLYRILTEPKKQLSRCWQIITTLPAIFREEKRKKVTNH